jgi:heme-degrading monooxygenase HmoA
LAVIVRHWRGLAKAHRADEYESHLRAETLPALRLLAGFLGAEVLRRGADDGVEFLVITRWASIDAIAQFAGDDAEAAVVPAKVHAMMVEFDARAKHYEMASAPVETS